MLAIAPLFITKSGDTPPDAATVLFLARPGNGRPGCCCCAAVLVNVGEKSSRSCFSSVGDPFVKPSETRMSCARNGTAYLFFFLAHSQGMFVPCCDHALFHTVEERLAWCGVGRLPVVGKCSFRSSNHAPSDTVGGCLPCRAVACTLSGNDRPEATTPPFLTWLGYVCFAALSLARRREDIRLFNWLSI